MDSRRQGQAGGQAGRRHIHHGMATLIPQYEHEGLIAKKVTCTVTPDGVRTVTQEAMIDQRDCVENLVRNLFNLAFLFENGELRPGVEEKLAGTPLLVSFYASYSALERVSHSREISRAWLDCTLGFERFGVLYDPVVKMGFGVRELLTGIDNITSLIEGMISTVKDTCSAVNEALTISSVANNVDNIQVDNISIAQANVSTASATSTIANTSRYLDEAETSFLHVCADNNIETFDDDLPYIEASSEKKSAGPSLESLERIRKINRAVELLSSPTMDVSWLPLGVDVLNYDDITLKFKFTDENGKRRVEKVKLFITTDHVCIRHGDEFAH